MNSLKSHWRHITTILLFAILSALLFFVCLKQIADSCMDTDGLLNWDAKHYAFIAKQGYSSDFRTAFFPLFPKLWGVLGLSAIGISIFNGLVYLISFFWLSIVFRIPYQRLWLYLGLPTAFFFYLPYTEALFFLTGSLVLIGMNKGKESLVLLGLFLSVLCRPAFTVFIPALFIIEYLDHRPWNIKRLLIRLLVIFLGLLSVSCIQWMDNGEWFTFFSAQEGWGNSLRLPEFPLSSWGGGPIVKLDGTAMLCAFLSGCGILYLVFIPKSYEAWRCDPATRFSLCYLAGIGLLVLLFRGGLMFSLSRFVFASPFIILAVEAVIAHRREFNWKRIGSSFLVFSLFFLLIGSFVHLRQLLMFSGIAAYMSLWVMLSMVHKRGVRNALYAALTVIQTILFCYYGYRFLIGDWVA